MHAGKQDTAVKIQSKRNGPCTASRIISWFLIVLLPAIVVLLLLGMTEAFSSTSIVESAGQVIEGTGIFTAL